MPPNSKLTTYISKFGAYLDKEIIMDTNYYKIFLKSSGTLANLLPFSYVTSAKKEQGLKFIFIFLNSLISMEEVA